MSWKGTLRYAKGARRYNDRVTLVRYPAVEDEFGHVSFGAAVKVLDVFAEVRQMSATKTMLTFQQANVVGVDLEFRMPAKEFNGAVWRGHEIHFPTPEILEDRGRAVKVSGWYQVDAPVAEPAPTPTPTPTAEAVVAAMTGGE